MPVSLLLQALKGTNEKVPVWFMRQAGRYLPEYRKLKEKYSLQEMFLNFELAAQITCQPVSILGVDAAILFADILTLPAAMGFTIKFDNDQGPLISKKNNLDDIHDFSDLSYISKAIKLVNEMLPKHIPLIGFAGSPFTVLTYLLEGGSGLNFSQTFECVHKNPKQYHQLMKVLTKNTIDYLNLQKEAGIKVFQLFDTWAGVLRASDYAHWVLPYVEEIFKKVNLPSIYYVKNCNHLLALMDKTDADFLSVCHTVVVGHHTTIKRTKKGIQGNLFNGLLFADDKLLKKEIADVLIGAQQHERFIFNLSHGILPNADFNKLKFIVNQVHNFPWKRK